MKKLRFGGYEVHRIDKFNIGIFRVVESDEKKSKGNIIKRTSDDGAALEHLGKYYGSYAAAARALHKILIAQRIEDPEVASVADALDLAREEFRPVSEAIGAAAEMAEAAR